MNRVFLHSKLHNAICTSVDLNYEGSISIDKDYMEAVEIAEYEQVDVYNKTNGNRFTTYAISAPSGSKEIQVNGAAAHLTDVGDELIICSYCLLHDGSHPGYGFSKIPNHKPNIKIL